MRAERFGAIVGSERPAALFYVNRPMARRLGLRQSPLWRQPERGYLSAPTEVHFSITNSCPLKCEHCYAGAGEPLPNELPDAEVHRTLEALAAIGVFHIAFGGGEPFAHPRLLDFARRTRELGMVPNVTTNGFYMTEQLARASRIFGQINVSLDGVGKMYEAARGVDGFPIADRALRLLRAAGANVGVNTVLSRRNIGHLPEVLSYARKFGVRRMLLLRWKPSGRGRGAYAEMAPTCDEQLRTLRYLRRASLLKGMLVALDCSFVPQVCALGIKPEALRVMDVGGCEGGRILAGVWPDGGVSACSHCAPACYPARQLSSLWEASGHFQAFRERPARLPEPCRSCKYLSECKGGCPVVAEAVAGDFCAPDPGCPLVAAGQPASGSPR